MSTDRDQIGSVRTESTGRHGSRPWLIPAASWIAYILLFGPLHASFGLHTGVLAFVPVVFTAWRGALPGVAGGLAAVPITDLLVAWQSGAPLLPELAMPPLTGAVAMVLVGFVVGRMRDLGARTRTEITEQQRVERDLRERETRVAVTSDIVRTLRDGQSTDRTIQATVDSLHAHFPHLRSAYSTIAPDGRTIVDRSVGPAGLTWPASAGEPVLTAQAMRTLRTRDLIVIEDAATGIMSGAASAELVAGNARAVLGASVHHSETPMGLLSLDSSTPRQWSEHERVTLRDAADVLVVALRAADARRQLEDSERKFRLVAESSQAMIALLQEEGAVYVNPELVRLSEYSHDELMQTSLWDLVHPDDRDMIRSYRSRRLHDQAAPTRYETRIVTKSGATCWLDVRASTFELGGKPTILTTGLDITERKLWEQSISASEARLRTLMEHITDGVVLIVDGTIAYSNPAMGLMLGYTSDKLAGHQPTEALVPGDWQKAMDRIDALTNGASEYPDEYQMVRRDGTTVPVLISSRRIEYDGRPALLSIVHDLTAQRLLEEQLRQTQRLESVGQLAGGVAHNFNNALAAIIGYSELIARQLDDSDPVLADVKQILVVSEQAASLTQQLLAFSRKEQIDPTIFNLNQAVESSSALLGPLLGAQVQLQLRLDRSLRDVRADRRQMEQVITNLVINARDAMVDGGSLTIETSDVAVTDALARVQPDARSGSYAKLSVTDTGTGMDRATVERIFEPFFTTKEPGQGVGLGLSMLHGAVKQAGGFVTVDSELGRGTTFGLYLPVHDEPADGSVVVGGSVTS